MNNVFFVILSCKTLTTASLLARIRRVGMVRVHDVLSLLFSGICAQILPLACPADDCLVQQSLWLLKCTVCIDSIRCLSVV